MNDKDKKLPPLPTLPPFLQQGGSKEEPALRREDEPRREDEIARPIKPDPIQRIAEVVVFCALALVGGGLFALVALTDINWVYPAVFYGVLAYIAWDRFFSR